jgi:hypothetical protein
MLMKLTYFPYLKKNASTANHSIKTVRDSIKKASGF